jgi:general secretion pathway protein M
MKEWFAGLQPRERVMVLAGAAALALIFGFFGLWRPLDGAVEGLRQAAERQTEALVWMRQASAEVRALQSGGAGSTQSGGSLLTVIDRSARAADLKGALERMEPEGTTAVRLWVAPSSFDALIRWLGELEGRHGLRITAASFEPTETPGTVQARITLERPES